ncbi:MAG: 16S rRNA (uracil(1498)-N(3))-methyltransferase [Ignavibacteriaceae bacterium]|nr:16S rRNA (uracil(1498)-N(3))-methyltransferase [Ignavibacteriaceae bacterium]
MDYLSNTSLFYSAAEPTSGFLTISGEEYHHIVQVLRLKRGSIINITDGVGSIYSGEIHKIGNRSLEVSITRREYYEELLKNVTLVIPVLKSHDRLEFALEKCTELGITRFTIYYPLNSLKTKIRIDRVSRVLIAAMKQSLRPYLPGYSIIGSLSELEKGSHNIILDQKGERVIGDFICENENRYNLIIGPEYGFDEKELSEISPFRTYRLNPARLRTETAAVSAAAFLNSLVQNVD